MPPLSIKRPANRKNFQKAKLFSPGRLTLSLGRHAAALIRRRGSPAARLHGECKPRRPRCQPAPITPGPRTGVRSSWPAWQRLEQWLVAAQIPYAVFGSVAAAAWIDQGTSLDFDRPGARHPVESIPDIDLLVPRASLDRVKRYARAARGSDFPVSIDTFWSECWIDFRPGSQLSYLTHREVRVPGAALSCSLLLQRRCWDSRSLCSTRGRCCTCTTPSALTRRKDAPRITALTEALATGTLASRFTGQEYQAFGSFMLARRRRYPLFSAAKRAWVMFTDALPPRASQALTHHVQLRANAVFRMLNRRQGRRLRRCHRQAGAQPYVV